ncbi:hypothetical protein CSAL01_13424 [Colletotrichum salicis]|uniref:Zn(2)-C6 fungal-type domain-containing protein n=1 Tax=Colletotrichum salicis TaxID=1209931 RepID=A0A135TY23_9PEZI|nr:hypothetical protein CSAL01_13424 [Colletotrichum salicis]
MTDLKQGARSNAGGTLPALRRSCDSCHRGKVKCDGNRPACERCFRRNVVCVYSYPRPIGRLPENGMQSTPPRLYAWFEEFGTANTPVALASEPLQRAGWGSSPEATRMPSMAHGPMTAGGDDVTMQMEARGAGPSAVGREPDDDWQTASNRPRGEVDFVGGAAAAAALGQHGSGVDGGEDPGRDMGEHGSAAIEEWQAMVEAFPGWWPGTNGATDDEESHWGTMTQTSHDSTEPPKEADMNDGPGPAATDSWEGIETTYLSWEWVAIGPGTFLVTMPL